MPVLNVDGFEIPQSAAITRYLARKFGFAGKTPEEEAWVDAVVDQFKDFFAEFRKLVIAKRVGKSAEELEKLTAEVIMPAMDVYFKVLNGLLEKSKSGYLIGDSITFADLYIADNIQTLKNYGLLEASGEQPKLAAHLEKVYSHPNLKSYIASRPVTEI